MVGLKMRRKGLRVKEVLGCCSGLVAEAGREEVEGSSCMRRRHFVRARAGQRRHRSAGCDSYPLLGLGLPSLSGFLMAQEM